MEENPDMTAEGQNALMNYQTNSNNLTDVQTYFEQAVSKFEDLKSVINRNEQEMSDIMKDIGSLKSFEPK
jgi:hypothetical protein